MGASWKDIQAVVLTHTHSDHWNDRTLTHLFHRGLPLYCHPEHHAVLGTHSSGFIALRSAGLVRDYEPGREIQFSPALRCWPLLVRHDGGATCGFRMEAAADLFGGGLALAYLADLGCWDDGLATAVADVDLLALEFNHDVGMQYASGRQPQLIARILGDDGHLSNVQAASFLRDVLRRSTPERLQHLVQLHLSRDCNRPALAAAAAQEVAADLAWPVAVHTAAQAVPGPRLYLGFTLGTRLRRGYVPARKRKPLTAHPWLPGLDNG
jgi:phosphoribosyl 1,2-cyclic phosphodiesterase